MSKHIYYIKIIFYNYSAKVYVSTISKSRVIYKGKISQHIVLYPDSRWLFLVWKNLFSIVFHIKWRVAKTLNKFLEYFLTICDNNVWNILPPVRILESTYQIPKYLSIGFGNFIIIFKNLSTGIFVYNIH